MIEVDLHSHSIFSNCGLHSFMELLQCAKARGMKGLAVTDHGLDLGGRLNSVFFERLIDPVEGIKLLKGVECNITQRVGEIDYPMQYNRWMDVVLLGFHPTTPHGQGERIYTDRMLAAMDENRYVDIITHPNDPHYPVDMKRIAKAGADLNIAIEINNSKNMLNRTSEQMTEQLLTACMETGCKTALCSDAHAVNELGLDDAVRPIMERVGFPEDLLVNRDAKSAFEFIASRKDNRRSILG